MRRERRGDPARGDLGAGTPRRTGTSGRPLANATVRGAFALRACLVNHRTTPADVEALVDEVLAAADRPDG